MKKLDTKLGRYIHFIFILFILIIYGCKKNEEFHDVGIDVNETQPQVDNSADSLLIVDHIDCGTINIGGDFNYDENGKIYYQYSTSRYYSDGRFVYESIDGVENGMLECGEEQVEYDSSNSSNNQNVQTQKQWVNCKKCHGTGLSVCYSCGGDGMSYDNKKECYRCNGKGTYGDCDECDGRGQVLMEF